MNQLGEFISLHVLGHLKIIETIVFWYPIAMSMLWIIGSLIYYFRIERKKPLALTSTPMVSILVPAYNESENIELTIKKLNEIDYPNFEIIIINDGSKDDSPRIDKKLANTYKRVRFIDLKENCGKANALYLGLIASKGEFLVCVDGDSYLDKDCLKYMIPHFTNPNNGERVGAVTGNPRVRNRSSLLAKIQLCEYASIISLIKRTQRIWGKVMTVSGVVVAFRKRALLDCGLWDRDLITEDIGVTWKLEKNFWDIRYEPRALCWMLVPETLKGLIKQRKRWAQGGQEVMIRHSNIFQSWKRRRLIPIYLEQVMSLLWVCLWALLTLVEILKLNYHIGSYMPYLWKSQFIAIVCIFQFLVAALLERKYDENMMKSFLVVAWYPIIYWIVNGVVALMALPSALRIRARHFATWNSPDRGIPRSDKKKRKVHKHKREMKNVIVGRQKKWKKIIEVILSLIAWGLVLIYVGYILYACISLLTGHKPYEIGIYNITMLYETKDLLQTALRILLIEIIFMLFWKEYNRLKYGKLQRRSFKEDITSTDLAVYFNKNINLIHWMQTKKIIILNHNIIADDFTPNPLWSSRNGIAAIPKEKAI